MEPPRQEAAKDSTMQASFGDREMTAGSSTRSARGREAAPAASSAEDAARHTGKKPWAAVLALGAGSQIAQIVLLREMLMSFYGNEISLGIILSSWMIWVGIGSYSSGRLIEGAEASWRALCLTAIGMLFLLPATVLTARTLRGLFQILPGVHLSLLDTAVSCFVIMAPVGLLLGAQFVLLARLWRHSSGSKDTSPASGTYVTEAAGNMASGLVFTLLLVRFASSFHLAVLVGLLLLLGALHVLPKASSKRRLTRPWRMCLWTMTGLAVLALPAMSYLDDWAYRAQWRVLAPDHTLIGTKQSPHGAISVLRQGEQHAFFQSGHLAFTTAAPGSAGFELEEMDAAVLAHLALAQHPEPSSLLLIGGGLRGILREATRHPLQHIDYVEFDREMLPAAWSYLPEATISALQDERVRALHGDGRTYIRRTERTYDLILVDIPDPATAVLNRYYTENFFAEARGRLAPSGVLAINVGTAGDIRGTAVANRNATVFHTMREVFPHVLPLSVSGQAVLLGSDEPGGLTADPSVLANRHTGRGIDASAFPVGYFFSVLEESTQRRHGWLLMNHGRDARSHLESPKTGPVFPPSLQEQEAQAENLPPVQNRHFHNSDLRPIGYFYTVLLWDRITRGERPPALDWALHVRLAWALPLILACLLPVASSRLRGMWRNRSSRAPARAARLAAATTGMSTMAMQVGLLFAFQSLYGFVYEMVGAIVAAFMAGLAGGAFIMQRVLQDRWRCLAVSQLAVVSFAVLVALCLPLAASIGSSGAVLTIFALLTVGAGLANGLTFPAAVACCHEGTPAPERAAGTAYGLELAGACLGALIASVMVAPMLGIVACFWLAGVMNATALAALVLAGSLKCPAVPQSASS